MIVQIKLALKMVVVPYKFLYNTHSINIVADGSGIFSAGEASFSNSLASLFSVVIHHHWQVPTVTALKGVTAHPSCATVYSEN